MNPFIGVGYHWIGGLAAASFYLPYKRVRHWSWETYWLVGGVFSWVLAPCFMAWLMVPELRAVFAETPLRTYAWTYFWGMAWGVGGLTFGLSMRYLGIGLGYALTLGITAAFGTLMPPIFEGTFGDQIAERAGQVTLLGIALCLVGIGFIGMAGYRKEREVSGAAKREVVAEFDFFRGVIVAIVAGSLSAAMAYGLAAAKPMGEIAVRHGTNPLWAGLPQLVVILAGGFTTNCLWCLGLNLRNRTWREYFTATTADPPTRVPLKANYLLCAAAGLTWYFQFFFYTMGTSQMGRYEFSSWTLHMAGIIVFSTLWGVLLREWAGSTPRTRLIMVAGVAALVGCTVIVGWGNYLGDG